MTIASSVNQYVNELVEPVVIFIVWLHYLCTCLHVYMIIIYIHMWVCVYIYIFISYIYISYIYIHMCVCICVYYIHIISIYIDRYTDLGWPLCSQWWTMVNPWGDRRGYLRATLWQLWFSHGRKQWKPGIFRELSCTMCILY